MGRTAAVERQAQRASRNGDREPTRAGPQFVDALPARAWLLLSLQQRAGNRAVSGLVQRWLSADAGVQRLDDEEAPAAPSAPAQLQPEPMPRANETGLPDGLKSGVESLSGISLDDIQVHYNSMQPARLNALSYAQGTDIHVGPGQEEHLPHETWHVVQQAQGRVKPTMQLQDGVAVNDDKGLEHEADVMGRRAAARGRSMHEAGPRPVSAAKERGPSQSTPTGGGGGGRGQVPVVQRAVGFEFETNYVIEKVHPSGQMWIPLKKMDVVQNYADGIDLTADITSSGETKVELVLQPPVQEDDPAGFAKAVDTFRRVGNAFSGLGDRAGNRLPLRLLAPPIHGPAGFAVTPQGGGKGFFSGNPQMTGGIAFDKLIDFIASATFSQPDGDAHGSAKSELTIAPPASTSATAASIPGSPELKGLVALLVMYLKQGAMPSTFGSKGPMLNYAKLISNSFMARTDFGSMFNRLPDNEKKRFIQNRSAFVDLVMNASGLDPDQRVFERGVRKSDIPKIGKRKNIDNPDYSIDAAPDLTRRRWLEAITLGTDLISSMHMPELKEQLMGLGALGARTDRVGRDAADGHGIIIELRNMRQDQTPDEFGRTAQAIFDYIVALNQAEQDEAGA